MVCLSQLSRKVEDRGDKRPMLSDLRDSGAIEQDADVVILMFRESITATGRRGIAEAIVAKQRMGETGTIKLAWRGHHSRFRDLAPEGLGGDQRGGAVQAEAGIPWRLDISTT